MKQLLSKLIESLREELKQYGELLAQLEHQQQLVLQRHTQDLRISIGGVNAQAGTVQAARRERELHQRNIAVELKLDEAAQFAEILPLLPKHYRGLIHALVQENNELLVRVQQRARQNQVLLSDAVELMQRFLSVLPGAAPVNSDGAKRAPQNTLLPKSLCEPVG